MGNLPLGQGLSVTPIQMAAAYSAIANGGVLRPPRLIAEADGEPVAAAEGERIISAGQRRQAARDARGRPRPGRHRLRGERPRLHARRQDRNRGEGGRRRRTPKTQFVASFVGFAPAEDPQLLVAVVVDEPQGDYYGGTVAAPAFGEIAKFALPYLGVEAGASGRLADVDPGRRRRAIQSPRWSSARSSPALRSPSGPPTPAPRCPASPTDSRDVEAGHPLLLRPRALAATATTSRPARSRPARPPSWSSAASTSPCRRRWSPSARGAMAPAAVAFFGDPTAELRVAGITGTNGKTTTAFLLRHVLERAGTPTGQLGTVKQVVGGRRVGGRADDARGDRPPAHLPARCSTPATGPA